MEKRKTPRIRFKGFSDDWEQRKLGDIVTRVVRKNENLESKLPLTISAQFGLIAQDEFFDKRIASKNISHYYLIRKGEFAYNKSTSMDAPWGAIKRLEHYDNGVLSTLYIMFRILDENKVNSDYIVSYYVTNLWHKGVREVAAEGARNHGLLNIAPVDFFETTLTIPSNENEQKNIGEYFRRLDRLITLHQRKLEKLKIIKKSMLENCFPKNGEKVPQIRFSGFTNDWEQRKLGKLVAFSKGAGYSKGDLKENGTPIILYGRLYTKYETVISDVDTFADAKENSVYSKGGEVIVPASGETTEDISIASVVEKSGVLLGGDLNVITPANGIDSAFLAISISNGKPHNDMAKMAQGKSVVHLHNLDLAKIDFPYPSYKEQQKIRKYFSNLDHLITLHQSKLEKLQKIKKALLERMFV